MMELSANAMAVLERRYLIDGETPQDMFRRVAHNVAQVEKQYGADPEEVDALADVFYGLMASLDFLPNSPTLRNAGREMQQLSACFVLPIEDSLDSIFESLKNAALVHKSGGGTGFNFSKLRPKGDTVSTTGNYAGGPISFMKVFNAMTQEVTQGGVRMGANMGILRVDHPDILDFIHCKDDGKTLSAFNISVALTDEFMEAVQGDAEYALVNPRTGEEVKKLRAREVFSEICESAWKTGDPGAIFIDTINHSNPIQAVGAIEATNPCGEQPLLANESCNLGSINLANFVENGKVDYQRLKGVVYAAVHFLDNVIDANRYPLQAIEVQTKANRKIGLGVMGWADVLVMLGIPYDSEEAARLAKNVMGLIKKYAFDASSRLAEQKGSFSNFRHGDYDAPMRNAQRTTIAPTGTLSIIADVNGGIEPFFAIAYQRQTLFDERGATKTLVVVNQHFERVAKERGFYSDEIMGRISEEGSIQHIDGIPDDVKRVFVTAHDIEYKWHIQMQASFQKYTDNAISKTINFPSDATVEDVKEAYLLAWDIGCKGITVYRDGCRNVQVLETKKASRPVVKKRERVLPGYTYRSPTPFGNAFITINENGDNYPFEVFVTIGKAGSDVASVSEGFGRLLSLILRLPSEMTPSERLYEIVGQLSDIGGSRTVGLGPNRVKSLPDAIARVLSEYASIERTSKSYDICPECGQASFVIQEGCKKCFSCAYSEC